MFRKESIISISCLKTYMLSMVDLYSHTNNSVFVASLVHILIAIQLLQIYYFPFNIQNQ